MADEGTQTPPAGTDATGSTNVTSFESWFETLGEPQKALVSEHTSKLKKALDSERDQLKPLKAKLSEAQAAAEKGSKLEADLTKLNDELGTWQRRAQFYEAAPTDLANARLAWLVATTDDLFNKKGEPDWDEIRKRAPELFVAKKIPPGNAGSGNGSGSSQLSPAQSMNAFIRQASGHGQR